MAFRARLLAGISVDLEVLMRWLSGGFALLLVLPCGASAQRQSQLALQPDSFLVRAVVEEVILQMGDDLTWGVLSRDPRAWRIEMPSNAPEWKRAQTGLYRLLNAVPATPNDSAGSYLRIAAAASADSALIFTVETGKQWRCQSNPSRWIGGFYSFRVRAVRGYSHYWAATHEYGVVADPGVCESSNDSAG
jgi:hypothetical protein